MIFSNRQTPRKVRSGRCFQSWPPAREDGGAGAAEAGEDLDPHVVAELTDAVAVPATDDPTRITGSRSCIPVLIYSTIIYRERFWILKDFLYKLIDAIIRIPGLIVVQDGWIITQRLRDRIPSSDLKPEMHRRVVATCSQK